MFSREPAVVIAALAAALQAIVIWLTNDPTPDMSWVMPVLTVLSGVLTRGQVFSPHTLRQADLNPALIEAKATARTEAQEKAKNQRKL